MSTTLIQTNDHAELGAAAVEDRLCVCNCSQLHRHRDVCSLIADESGGRCPGCTDNDVLDAPGPEGDSTLDGYTTVPWSAWRVLTVPEPVEEAGPVDGFLVINTTWTGHRRGGRPAAIRTAGRITHVGIIAEIHPAASCPDSWDGTTDCHPWGAVADPARPHLAHWCLAEVVELPEPIRHKIAGWMTPRTCGAITAQL